MHEEPDKSDNSSSNDTHSSFIPGESNTDLSEIHDNNESIGDSIALGGLASFVKSSSIGNDYCKLNYACLRE